MLLLLYIQPPSYLNHRDLRKEVHLSLNLNKNPPNSSASCWVVSRVHHATFKFTKYKESSWSISRTSAGQNHARANDIKCHRAKTAKTPSNEIKVRNLYLASAANRNFLTELSSFGIKSNNKQHSATYIIECGMNERSTNLRICKNELVSIFDIRGCKNGNTESDLFKLSCSWSKDQSQLMYK